MKKCAALIRMTKPASLALLLGTMSLHVGCGGGSSDGPSGAATVEGSVSSVAGSGAMIFRPAAPEGWRGLLARISSIFVPDALAAVEGVTVRVAGTDLVATTADDGSFIISGVPGGEQTLIFSYGSTTASLVINVPNGSSTVRLNDIDVSTGSVDVAQVQVEVDPNAADDNANVNANDDDANENGDDDNGNDDNGNDDNDNDDNGNDDNGNDDNGNDDNGNDDNGNDDNDNN